MKKTPIVFPRAHMPRDVIIEWWYYNGHLRDALGRRYAFMDCLFKVNALKANIPFSNRVLFPEKHPHLYFAHSVLTDITNKRNEKDVQPYSLVSRDSFTRPELFVNYLNPLSFGFTNHEIAQTGPASFHIKTDTIDLALDARKPPLLEQGSGYVEAGDRIFGYYSFTDLSAKGLIRANGKWIAVEGKAWMDHQWADMGFNKDRWNWFSLQLDNGSDVMCAEYIADSAHAYIFDIIDRNGKAMHGHDVRLTPSKKKWRSTKSGISYALSWTIEIPSRKAILQVKAPVTNQEMLFFNIDYWEGPLDVSGIMDGKPVKGVGFMELVHAGKTLDYLALAEQELQKKAIKKLKGWWRS